MKLSYVLCAAAMLCLMSACSSDPVNETDSSADFEITFTGINDTAFAEQVFAELNAYRESIDLQALQWDANSEDVATGHSYYMSIRNKPSHDNFMARSTYLKSRGAKRVAENVAYGFTDAQSVVTAWIASPAHRAALEGDYTHTGIGILKGDNGVTFFTQMFTK